jgi:lipoyl-dependent peroxiredoxin
MVRKAIAHWSGNLKEGKGTLTTESKILKEATTSFSTRFEEGASGTNPEELLAAAHASCFTMAVAGLLTHFNSIPTILDTEASVTMEGLSIKKIHLSITASVPGMTVHDFTTITKDAEEFCIISKALKIPISSEVHFV